MFVIGTQSIPVAALRRRSVVADLLRVLVRIPRLLRMLCIVRVEVTATDRSLIPRNHIRCVCVLLSAIKCNINPLLLQ